MIEWPHRPLKHKRENGKVKSAPFYFRWRSMRSRCEFESSTESKRYKARGIRVCEEWQEFWNFYDWCVKTYEPGKTIDRVDNNGNYSPKNCRWSTPLEQQLNSRTTPERIAGMKKAKKAQIKYLHAKWGNPKTRKVKNCFRCKVVKPLKEFSKNKCFSDGLQKECKQCQARRFRERNKR